jgi:phenylpropionate dioxygenase-like ring-hydroxylating dioxygenase large terminal subunit
MHTKSPAVAELAFNPEGAPAGKEQVRFTQNVFRRDSHKAPDVFFKSSTDDLGLSGISIDRYFTREFHDLEVQKVWGRAWQMACWSQDIPNPGDVHVYRIVDASIVIVRQTDGSLRAFHNSCLHRGRQIVDDSGHVPALRCPFHGWTWNLNGSLRHVPCRWDFPQVSDEQFGLRQVRVEEWNGFAFITLHTDAPPLLEYLEDVPQHFAAWDFSQRFKAAHVEKHVPCNWKLMLEAFIEAYHVPATHKQLIEYSSDAQGVYDTYPGRRHFSRAITLTGFMSGQYPDRNPSQQAIADSYICAYYPEVLGTDAARVPEGSLARDVIYRVVRQSLEKQYGVSLDSLGTAEVIDAIWYHIFPNFMPWPTLGYPLFYRFRPEGSNPDRSIMDIMLLLPFQGERPPSAPTVRQGSEGKLADVLGGLGAVLDQDVALVGGLQSGVRASVNGTITPSQYQESRLRRFHKTLDEYVAS